MKRFPRDCKGDCPHIRVRDLSIEDFCYLLCPLEEPAGQEAEQ